MPAITDPDAKQGEPSAVRRDAEQTSELELRLNIHGEFTDVLHELMQACEESPAEARVLNLLERSLESVVEVTDSEIGTFMLREGAGKTLVLVLHHGPTEPGTSKWRAVPEGEGIAHWVAEHNRAAVVNNAEKDPRCVPEPAPGRGRRVRSAIAVPLVAGDQVLGVVEVINKRHGALYAMRDRKRLELICHFDGKLLAALVQRVHHSKLSSDG